MKLDKKVTSIITENGFTRVILYATVIVEFNEDEIRLDFGGFPTNMTRKRMNQVSEAFALGYRVYQKNFRQYVEYDGHIYVFGFNSAGKKILRRNVK